MHQITLFDNAKISSEFIENIFDSLTIRENTKIDYLKRIVHFTRYWEQIRFESNYNANDVFIKYWKLLERSNRMSVSTKNKYLSVARAFLKELHRRSYLPVDITAGVKSFSGTVGHKRDGLTLAEAGAILHHVLERDNDRSGARLKAITALLFFQGLRQIEISRLQFEDLRLPEQKMMVKGKGMHDKVPIHLQPQVCNLLRNHLYVNEIRSGPVFFSFSNRGKGKAMTTRSIARLFTDPNNGIFAELGISKNKSVHGFRHFFTTHLLEQFNGDIVKVMAHTRHKKPETVMIYFDELKQEKSLPEFYAAFSDFAVKGDDL